MRPRNAITVIVEVDPSAGPFDMEAVAKGFVNDLLGDTRERLQSWADEVDAEIAKARRLRPVEDILREARALMDSDEQRDRHRDSEATTWVRKPE